ncbi:hypothetical protein [Desulforhopalus sp. IMCC35007]|uniref:hypothetical protein n=1 Tax=Desulforhopalus sp. IMCC35007 TaxID=2569543 RepID=UPI00145D4F05|nr:hypothetical protein [Desulforhopalus sp. IMCC35007]
METRIGQVDQAGEKKDGPSGFIIRGNHVIVLNFNAAFDNPEVINKKATIPRTLCP